MDIMNNMTVSTSKLTFSLIAFTALLLSSSYLMSQDASAAIDAPEFTAIHINTTATHVQFDQSVNGTLAVLDWAIMKHSCANPCLVNPNAVDGSILTEVSISNIANSTSTGVGLTVPNDADKARSSSSGVVGLGFINGTDIVLIHSAIDTDSSYFVNYTNNAANAEDGINQPGQIHAMESGESRWCNRWKYCRFTRS